MTAEEMAQQGVIEVPILCSSEIADSLVGARVWCDWFRIIQRDDGHYELMICQGRGDGALTDLDWELEIVA